MALIKQGPFLPTSGFVWWGGDYDNAGSNWQSNSQLALIRPGHPSAIYTDDAPDGSTTNPYAWTELSITTGYVYTNMFSVCKFGFSLPSDAQISGVEVEIRGIYSGTTIPVIADVSYGQVKLAFSGNFSDGISNWSGVPLAAAFSSGRLTPGPSSIPNGYPHTTDGSGLFGGNTDLWDLQGLIRPDDSISGVNHPCFGVTFGVKAIATGVVGPTRTYHDTVLMSVYYALPPPSSGMTLYTAGHLTNESGISLYTSGAQISSNNVDLFVNGHDSLNNNIPLFINGHSSVNSGIDLFINGHSLSSGEFPLMILGPTGQSPSGWMDLFIYGSQVGTGVLLSEIPLLIQGEPPSGTIPLFINGHSSVNSGIDLFINGHSLSSGEFPLMILGPTGQSPSGWMDLFIYGSQVGTGVLLSEIPLLIQGEPPSGTIPLFIKSDFDPTGLLPLYISGSLSSLSSGISLYIENNTPFSGIPLFIQGQQLTQNPGLPYNPSGWIPYTGGISLFIQRNESAMTSMFIAGKLPESSNIPLYIASYDSPNSGISLYSAGKDAGSGIVKLFIHGAHH